MQLKKSSSLQLIDEINSKLDLIASLSFIKLDNVEEPIQLAIEIESDAEFLLQLLFNAIFNDHTIIHIYIFTSLENRNDYSCPANWNTTVIMDNTIHPLRTWIYRLEDIEFNRSTDWDSTRDLHLHNQCPTPIHQQFLIKFLAPIYC